MNRKSATPLSVRQSEEEREALQAVAWDLAMDPESGTNSDEGSLSAVVRLVLNQFVAHHFEQRGGKEQVMRRYLEAQAAAEEARLASSQSKLEKIRSRL